MSKQNYEAMMASINRDRTETRSNYKSPYEAMMAWINRDRTETKTKYTAQDWADDYNNLLGDYNQQAEAGYSSDRYAGYEEQLSDLISKYDEVGTDIGREYLDNAKKMLQNVQAENWAQDYARITGGIKGNYDAVGDGYTKDYFGGYGEELDNLIDRYEQVSGVYDSQYRDSLIDLREAVKSDNQRMSQYADEEDYKRRGLGIAPTSVQVEAELPKLQQAEAESRAEYERLTKQQIAYSRSFTVSKEEKEKLAEQVKAAKNKWEEAKAKSAQMQAQKNLYDREKVIDGYDVYRDDPEFEQAAQAGAQRDYTNGYSPMASPWAAMLASAAWEKADPLGYYLANKDTIQAEAVRSGASTGDRWSWGGIEDQEKQMYYYLLETKGINAAKQYLFDLQIRLDKRETEKQEAAHAKKWESENLGEKILENALSIPANVIGGLAAGTGDVLNVIQKQYNPYDRSHRISGTAQETRAMTSQDIVQAVGEEHPLWGQVASNTYQALMSGGDSAMGMILFGKGYTATMGASAASSKATELYKKGASDWQIGLGAIAAGAIEIATETISYGKFNEEFLQKTMKGPKDAIKKILMMAYNEGAEETMSEIANIAVDAVVNGYNSDNQRDITKIMNANPGMSYEEAKAKAVMNRAMDVFWAAYGGFVSGGGMGITGTARGMVMNQQTGKTMMDAETAKEIIDTALELDPKDKTAKQMLQKLEKGTLDKTDRGLLEKMARSIIGLDNGQRRSFSDEAKMGQLYRQNQEGIAEQDRAKVKTAVEQRLQQLSDSGNETLKEKGNIQDVAEAITKNVAGEELSLWDRIALQKSTNAERVMNELNPENIAGGQYDSAWAEKIGTDNLNAQAYNLGLNENGKTVNDTAEPVTAESEEINNGAGEQTADARAAQQPGQPAAEQQTVQPGTEQSGQPEAVRTGELSDGGTERNAGERAGAESGRISAGPAQGQEAAGRSQTFNQRLNITRDLRGQLQKVSPRSLGIENGSESNSVYVIDEAHMDDDLRKLKDRIYNETGSEVTFVAGKIRVQQKNGKGITVRGIKLKNGKIVVQVDNIRYTAEQIADHEAFHAKVERFGSKVVADAVETIKSKFPKPEMLEQVLDKYLDGLAGVYDVEGDTDAEKDSKIHDMMMEELLADAYSGINSGQWGATKFTDIVNAYMDEHYIGKQTETETEAQRGPPAGETEKYSIEKTKDLPWDRQVTGALNKRDRTIARSDTLVVLNNASDSLLNEGIEDVPFAIPLSVISKSQDARNADHAVSEKNLRKLQNAIKAPVATIWNPSRNSIGFITSLKQESGNVVAFFERNTLFDGDNVHKATTIHTRENIPAMLKNLPEDAVIYVNSEKENEFNQLARSADSIPAAYTSKDKLIGDNLSQKNKDVNRDSFSVDDETDTDYLRAVMDGDTQTQEEMVREAAEAAGYTYHGYHGTPHGGFTVFDKERSGKRGRFASAQGIHPYVYGDVP